MYGSELVTFPHIIASKLCLQTNAIPSRDAMNTTGFPDIEAIKIVHTAASVNNALQAGWVLLQAHNAPPNAHSDNATLIFILGRRRGSTTTDFTAVPANRPRFDLPPHDSQQARPADSTS